MEIKICGIRSLDDIQLVNKYKPDYIGFIFYPPSPRFLNFQEARRLKEKLDPEIKVVGVFVDSDLETIISEYENKTFDIAQLHGSEDQSFIKALKNKDIPVIKAVKIKDPDSFLETRNTKPDFFLFDIYDKKKVGGTGESFNWKYLKNYQGEIPYFLAGGIDETNLETALDSKAHILDISSGVETDYKKDPEKFKRLFKKFNEINERSKRT